MPVNVDDRYCFHERNYNQTHCTCERVEHFQPVFAGACAKNQSDEEAAEAADTCNVHALADH